MSVSNNHKMLAERMVILSRILWFMCQNQNKPSKWPLSFPNFSAVQTEQLKYDVYINDKYHKTGF